MSPIGRAMAMAALLSALTTSCELLPAGPLTLVDCRTAWSCGDQETASEDDGEEDLCHDAAADGAADRVEQHRLDVNGDTCEAVPVQCAGGVPADCAVTCTQTAAACGADAGT